MGQPGQKEKWSLVEETPTKCKFGDCIDCIAPLFSRQPRVGKDSPSLRLSHQAVVSYWGSKPSAVTCVSNRKFISIVPLWFLETIIYIYIFKLGWFYSWIPPNSWHITRGVSPYCVMCINISQLWSIAFQSRKVFLKWYASVTVWLRASSCRPVLLMGARVSSLVLAGWGLTEVPWDTTEAEWQSASPQVSVTVGGRGCREQWTHGRKGLINFINSQGTWPILQYFF